MIIYSASRQEFQNDVLTNDISGIIHRAYKKATGRNTGSSELESWRNSLQYMDRVLNDAEIPADSTVAIAYHIPQSSKRIHFILCGQDANEADSAVLM